MRSGTPPRRPAVSIARRADPVQRLHGRGRSLRCRFRCGIVTALIAGCLVVAAAPFGPAATTRSLQVSGPSFRGTTAPTGTKRAESAVWWNDRWWWAYMWSSASKSFHIFRFNSVSARWLDTRVTGDRRANTSADVLWDGRRLYVASHRRVRDQAPARAGSAAYLYRFSYSARRRRYTLDRGFPTVINRYRTETVAIAKDTKGRLWATWQQDGRIYLNHTDRAHPRRWSVPVPLGFAEATTSVDDISSIVAFAGRVGIMWSNQNGAFDGFYFSVHRDGAPADAWSSPERALGGPRSGDDHINVTATSNGHVYAAVKTSSIHSAPLTLLLDRAVDGRWTSTVFGNALDCHNRPVVLIDERAGRLHMLATAPDPTRGVCTSSGGAIYMKTTPLRSISFQPGRGTLLLADAEQPFITNASVTRQSSRSRSSGLLALAANLKTSSYRTFYSDD